MAMSAPSWPGGWSARRPTGRWRRRRSRRRPWTAAIAARQSGRAPLDVGRLNSAPKQPPSSSSRVADDEVDADRLGTRRQHGDRLRVGVVVHDEAPLGAFDSRRAMVIASAAAVASSSSEALASSKPVSLGIIVWKLSRPPAGPG
jgi:hypothetical protein